VLVLVDDVAVVRGLAPERRAIAAFGVTGVNCFARHGDRWVTRMFWERGEDAATGSAAGPIACHLARHGHIAWDEEVVLEQGASIGRPSVLRARAEGGAGLIDAVEVGGSAVTVARGEFRV
jgi:trans-2,3-dihydro-3-hydroxyanthranilate isomerase